MDPIIGEFAGNERTIRLLRKASAYIGLIVEAVGLVILAGWIFDIPYVKNIIPGMVPNCTGDKME